MGSTNIHSVQAYSLHSHNHITQRNVHQRGARYFNKAYQTSRETSSKSFIQLAPATKLPEPQPRHLQHTTLRIAQHS